jgi:hypothetical protein
MRHASIAWQTKNRTRVSSLARDRVERALAFGECYPTEGRYVMRFPVAGTAVYSVRVAMGPVRLEDGTEVNGATLADTREILLAATCPPEMRWDVLLAELLRAWTFETAEPSTQAEWLHLHARCAREAFKAINQQGGERALLNLQPGESPQPMAARIGVGTNRHCALCDGTLAGGSVAWRPLALPGVAELRIYCEFCDVTQVWHEGMTGGMPNAHAMGAPEHLPGDSTGIRLRQPVA